MSPPSTDIPAPLITPPHPPLQLPIRGTISAADIVTDAMVASERLEHLLPVSLKEDVKGPCFGHTGMLAAAQAIFMDMKERGILTPLVGSEAAADDYSAPRGEGPPQRESQYDADTGPSPLRAAMGSAGQAIREGVAAVLPAGGWTGAGRPGDAVGDDIEAQRAAARGEVRGERGVGACTSWCEGRVLQGMSAEIWCPELVSNFRLGY